MASLTIELDDEVLERARNRANQQDTSVNALVRNYLETYAGVTREQQEAFEQNPGELAPQQERQRRSALDARGAL